MKFSEFKPTHYVQDEKNDNYVLHVMVAYSPKKAERAIFSMQVDKRTNTPVGNVVESLIRHGYNDAPYFTRNRVRYYLSWLKPLRKRVDKK